MTGEGQPVQHRMWKCLKLDIKKWNCFCKHAPEDSDEGAQTCDGRADWISATQHPSNSEQINHSRAVNVTNSSGGCCFN